MFLSVFSQYNINTFNTIWYNTTWHISGLGQDYSNSIANALELLQSCTKPSIQCFSGYGITYSISQEICTRFFFAVLCCGYTLTDFPISIRLTSLALWQSNDCPSVSKATLMNMDKYFMWIHYERLHNHNKAKHNKTVCIFLGLYCRSYVEQHPISRPHGRVCVCCEYFGENWPYHKYTALSTANTSSLGLEFRLSQTEIGKTSTQFRVWISNYIIIKSYADIH